MTAATLVRDLMAFSVQIALVTVAIAVLLQVVRIPAQVRYVGLRFALVALLVTPWLLRVPENLPAAESGTGSVAAPASPLSLATGTTALADESSPAAPRNWNIPWTPVVLGALLIGVIARGLWLVVGFARLRRLTRLGIVVDADYAELQQQMGTRATITKVVGVAQPATFGVRHPVVMLPDALAAAPESLRRAVITHELFHVRRHDWLSVLAEEMVRTVLWFHPAILWLTSHIQLAREEIVDELTVRATGDRRTYMQALLAFADTPGLSPAPAFAHRRQLFHRILSVSKEKAMSRPRIVMSTVVLTAAVFTTSWSASSLFPIVRAARGDMPTLTTVKTVSPLPRPEGAETVVLTMGPDGSLAIKAAVATQQPAGTVREARQVTPENPIPQRARIVSPAWPSQFAGEKMQVAVSTMITVDERGTVTAVERRGCTVSALSDLEPECGAFFDASATAIREWRYERPVQAPIQFNVVVTFRPGAEPAVTQSGMPLLLDTFGRSAGPTMLPELDVRRFVSAAVRRQSPGQTLRTPAPAVQSQDELARTEEELRRRTEQLRQELRLLEERLETLRAPRLVSPSGRSPIRLGGGAAGAPRVRKSPKPAYSLEAMEARVEGTVVVEALVDEQGRVADARVLKSIPLLDQSALAAAKQWEFTPTLLNGEPVPVVVMIELEFNLRSTQR